MAKLQLVTVREGGDRVGPTERDKEREIKVFKKKKES